MNRESPNWSLILTLYTLAAIVLILVRDEIGTGNDPYLKVVGWIALIFAVYWSIRGAFESLQRRCVTRAHGRCE
jgi:flagellar biosynthesis protein FliP